MDSVTQIEGINVSQKMKYLGIDLNCDRLKTIKSVKAKLQNFLIYLRSKIRSEHLDIQALIFSAYYRSLLTYFMVPLFAAGEVTEQEVNDFETNI